MSGILPSGNDTAARAAILDFAARVSTEASSDDVRDDWSTVFAEVPAG
jgi:hypothetical protein